MNFEDRGYCNVCRMKYEKGLYLGIYSNYESYISSDFFVSLEFECETCIRKFIYVNGEIPLKYQEILIEHYIHIFNNISTLQILLECGVNPNVIDKINNENLYHKLFKLDKGVFASNVSFEEYKFMAIELDNYRIPILKLLLKYNVDPFLVNKDGDNAFEVARKNGYQLFEPDFKEIEEFFNLENECLNIKEPFCG